MDPYATSYFSNRDLLLDFETRVARNHTSFAVLLTRIAEIDQRRLYLQEGYPSMKAFLVKRMHLPTEAAAYKRLTAARTARQYPGILVALSDGKLNLTAVLMLGPRLTSANADELVAAALDKTCFELEVMLAQRFPRPDLPDRVEAIATPAPARIPAVPESQLAARRVEATIPDQNGHAELGPVVALAPEGVEAPRPRVTPLAPQRFGFQCTVDEETQEIWQYARALLSHEIPSGEMALVLKTLLRIAIAELEKRRFGATHRPGRSRGSADPRHVPGPVKRAVWERDGGQCSFVSETGKRCTSRWLLELDHIEPVARGGEATVRNLRLLCRAHNQYMAEREFGAEFMSERREKGRRRSQADTQRHRSAGARAQVTRGRD